MCGGGRATTKRSASDFTSATLDCGEPPKCNTIINQRTQVTCCVGANRRAGVCMRIAVRRKVILRSESRPGALRRAELQLTRSLSPHL